MKRSASRHSFPATPSPPSTSHPPPQNLSFYFFTKRSTPITNSLSAAKNTRRIDSIARNHNSPIGNDATAAQRHRSSSQSYLPLNFINCQRHKMAGTNGASNGGAAATNGGQAKIGTSKVKQGLAQMLKGGVIVSYSFKLW